MRYNDFNEKLVGVQGFEPKKVEEIEGTLHIYGELPRKRHNCPCCGEETERIHDYRTQVTNDQKIKQRGQRNRYPRIGFMIWILPQLLTKSQNFLIFRVL